MSDTDSHQIENNPEFETDNRYAIVAGWLILPAIGVIFYFLGTLIYVLGYNSSYHLGNYIFNILYLIFYLVIIVCWIKRKNCFPN